MAGVGDVAREAGVKFEDASKVFDGICSLMKKLGPDDKITIQGLGTFRLRARNPREARNPKDAEAGPVHVGAKVIPDIDFNRTFKDEVEEECKEHLYVLLAKRNKTSVEEEMEKLGVKPKKAKEAKTSKDAKKDDKKSEGKKKK